jgi:hypothetical protein
MSLCQFNRWSTPLHLKESERVFLIFMAREAGICSDLPDTVLLTIQLVFSMDQTGIKDCETSWIEFYAAKHLESNSCICMRMCDFLLEEDAVQSLVHIWKNMDVPMTCYFIISVFEYCKTTGVMPDQFQLFTFLNNRQRIEDEPDEYCKDEQQIVATPGIEEMSPSRMLNVDETCSICLLEIVPGSNIVRLPQCGHVFHWDKKECLEEASILNWLQMSKFCPNCKTSVSFETSKKKKKLKRKAIDNLPTSAADM